MNYLFLTLPQQVSARVEVIQFYRGFSTIGYS